MSEAEPVSKAAAIFFYEQCAGEHAGHMAMIPNTPTLHGLLQAHRALSPKQFAEFLRAVATELEGR